MSENKLKSLFGFLSPKPAEANASGRASNAGFGVNSLSQITGQFSRLSEGDSVKTLSFWICFLLCASLLGDLAALLAEKYLPLPQVSPLSFRSRNGSFGAANPMSYEIIPDRNLFSSKAPKRSGESIDLESEPVLSSLGFQLVGTVIFRNPARSLAAIQDKSDNKLYPVRIGDQIGTNVQILSVEARKVIFINTTARRKEYIEIPEDPSIKISTAAPSGRTFGANPGISQTEDNKFVVSRAEIDAQTANFNVLITQARAVPEMRGGQMVGFRITQIVPNSFYSKIGLKDNDILKAVNGDKMTDAAKGLELYQSIKSMPSIDLTIERGGKDVSFNYDFR